MIDIEPLLHKGYSVEIHAFKCFKCENTTHFSGLERNCIRSALNKGWHRLKVEKPTYNGLVWFCPNCLNNFHPKDLKKV